MDLFNQNNEPYNLLSKGGIVYYYGYALSKEASNRYYTSLITSIAWNNYETVLFGKRIVTKRKVAWYAEKEFSYSYANTTKTALLFTEELLELKKIVEAKTNETYNACLLNLYHDGSEGMGWHSDDEKELQEKGSIASVSFGAERKFAFKHKETKEVVSLILHHGSLLIMKGDTQTNWLHRLPPTKAVQRPRINLTFRTINCK